MYFPEAAILLAVLPSALAATCNLSNAQTYIAGVTGISNGSGSSLQDKIDAAYVQCATACGTTASCLVNCLSTACSTYCATSSKSGCQSSCVSNPCPLFYGSGSATPDATKLQACLKAAAGGTKPTLSKRAELNCASNQSCYKENNGNYFCLDLSTGKCSSAPISRQRILTVENR